MSATMRIRFLQPVDPREVFDLAAGLVKLPEGEFQHQAPGSEDGDWPLNPRIRSNSGATRGGIIRLEYGAEGSRLVQEWHAWPEYADDYPAEQRGPDGYVELDITNSGGLRYEMLPVWEAKVIEWAQSRGIPAAVQDEFTGHWKT